MTFKIAPNRPEHVPEQAPAPAAPTRDPRQGGISQVAQHAGNAAATRAVQGTGGSAAAGQQFSIVIRGARHDALTSTAAAGLLRKHARRVHGELSVGEADYRLTAENRSDHPIIGAVSDTLGGVSLPSDAPLRDAKTFLSRADAALAAGDISRASQALDFADADIQMARESMQAYRAGTIRGGERAQTALRGTMVVCTVVGLVGGGVSALAARGAGAAVAGAAARTAATETAAETATATATASGTAAAPAAAPAAATGATGATATGTAAVGPTAAQTSAAEVYFAAFLEARPAVAVTSEAVAAAQGSAVGTEAAIASGALRAEGKLFQVLQRVEAAYRTHAPKTPVEAFQMLETATRTLSLQPGIPSAAIGGGIVVHNNGGVITYLMANGQVLVMQGAKVLLHLLP